MLRTVVRGGRLPARLGFRGGCFDLPLPLRTAVLTWAVVVSVPSAGACAVSVALGIRLTGGGGGRGGEVDPEVLVEEPGWKIWSLVGASIITFGVDGGPLVLGLVQVRVGRGGSGGVQAC